MIFKLSKVQKKTCKKLGIEWEEGGQYTDDDGKDCTGICLIAPDGKWFGNRGCHMPIVWDDKDFDEAIAGLEDCDDPDCECCHSEEDEE